MAIDSINLILTGKTQKGKNRIRELGTLWQIVRTADTVLFDTRKGPWALVKPIGQPDKSRWIHWTDDKDFVVASND